MNLFKSGFLVRSQQIELPSGFRPRAVLTNAGDLVLLYHYRTASPNLPGRKVGSQTNVLFFNLGFLTIKHKEDLSVWVPKNAQIDRNCLVVVDDNDMGIIHDMALYRQSRVKLGSDANPNQKKVDGGAFFNVEAIPEGSLMIFPAAAKNQLQEWLKLSSEKMELYFGGLESIGFGRCQVTLQQGVQL